ncbi:hypothetical protein [Methanobacterium sp. ACI-7]|uniref:hypothetical protein n=1 Tax=unclassified Methanobacterium TaxID=2627676 RepID=UPI0039C415BB
MNRIARFITVLIIATALASSFMPDGSYGYDNTSLDINSFKASNIQVLGSTDYGNVIKSGPYGNPNGTQKVAVIVGVHPLERDSHRAMISSLLSLNKSLNSSYYIYSIHVTKDRKSYNDGRMNGQLLASRFVVSDIKQNNFDLVVDVHSNRGENFLEKLFIFVPSEDSKSISTASNLIAQIPWLVYYVPPRESGPTSPSYVTMPVINSGTPAVIYEAYRYDHYFTTVKHAVDFIKAVDKLKLS